MRAPTTSHQLASLRNLVAAVFRLENSRSPGEVLGVVSALVDWLKDPAQASLRRAFTVWIKRVILADQNNPVSEHITELEELRTMLAQRVEEWKQEWREEGRAEGRAEMLNSERSMLLRLTRLRFDPSTADALSPLLDRIAEPLQLEQVGEWLILCSTGEALLAQVQELLQTPSPVEPPKKHPAPGH